MAQASLHKRQVSRSGVEYVDVMSFISRSRYYEYEEGCEQLRKFGAEIYKVS
jgi:hypothetical protein